MARVPDLIEYCAPARAQAGRDRRPDRVPPPHRDAGRAGDDRADADRVSASSGAIAYREKLTGKYHVALVMGEVDGAEDVLVRVHSECLTGDVFHSLRCDCGEQLEYALERIAGEGRGVLLYMSQEGRGIGLLNKLKAYELQEQGSRHGRGQPGAGLRRRRARVGDRQPDPRRPRALDHSPADEQSAQAEHCRLWTDDRRAGADRDPAQRRERALSGDETR